MFIYIFLDHRKMNGNKSTIEMIIEIKATFNEELRIKKEIINAAIPTATFSP